MFACFAFSAVVSFTAPSIYSLPALRLQRVTLNNRRLDDWIFAKEGRTGNVHFTGPEARP